MNIEAVTLTGKVVTLTPMTLADVDDLWVVAEDPDIWRYMPFPMSRKVHLEEYVASCIAQRDSGVRLPWVTRLSTPTGPGGAIGGTSFLTISTPNRRLEIGATWICPAWQRTAANTEAKLLQLTHAFDDLGAIRVEFKTDSLNEKSRVAIKRIGATEEGTFRNHMITPDGRYRHSVYFAITSEEWPAAKAALQKRLG